MILDFERLKIAVHKVQDKALIAHQGAVELCVFILDRDKFPNKGGLMRCLPGCLDNKRAIGSAPALPQYQTNSGQDGF